MAMYKLRPHAEGNYLARSHNPDRIIQLHKEPTEHRFTLIGQSENGGDVVISLKRRGDTQTARWQASFPKFGWNGTGSRYERPTLETTDLATAIQLAEQAFRDAKWRAKNGIAKNVPTLNTLASLFIAHLDDLVLLDPTTAGGRDAASSAFKFMLPYLGDKKLCDITDPLMIAYHKQRIAAWEVMPHETIRLINGRAIRQSNSFIKQPSTEVLRKQIQLMNRLAKWATKTKLINASDWTELSPLPRSDTRRGIIEKDNWAKLVAHLSERVNEQYRFERAMLLQWTLFGAMTGLRPGELNAVRFGDIETHSYGVLIHVRGKERANGKRTGGKTGYRATLCDISVSELVTKVAALHRSIGHEPSPNSPLWIGVDGEPLKKGYRETFKKVLRALGIDRDAEGNECTAYSMRHLHITAQRRNGTADWAIEQNSGTSAAQIAKHYSHATSADAVQALTRPIIAIPK